MNKLRIAPLIRVSTETQALKGESLRTQKDQIIQYAERLGGEIVSWDYSGQEHATPDQERKKLDKLLRDSTNGFFDAVMVCDLSRWSRDNRRSKEGIEILKNAGIRFFVGPTEYDLHSPEQCLFVGMATEMNEFFAKNQSLKSIQSRISRAKRGIPTSGKLPYGRTWTQNSGWGLDHKKQENIQYAASCYLSGESMTKIAKSLGMNHSNLWKILTKRAGSKWPVKFRNKKLNIDESFDINVPSLLSEQTIEAIKNQGASNKTYTHGQLKNKYLLGRVVLCSECGNAMFGQTNHGNRRYYRHPRGRTIVCDQSLWVPAQQLEDAVMVNLFAMFGDIERLEKAVEAATPNKHNVDILRKRLIALEKDSEGATRQKHNIVRAIKNGIINDEEASSEMEKLREREILLVDEKSRIEFELHAFPEYQKHLSALGKAIRKHSLSLYYRPESLKKMDYDSKRKVVQAAFAGKDIKGKRLGVYVSKVNAVWHYDIRGIIPLENFKFSQRTPILQGKLPMPKELAQNILGVDTDYSDFNPLTCDDTDITRFALS